MNDVYAEFISSGILQILSASFLQFMKNGEVKIQLRLDPKKKARKLLGSPRV